MGTAPRQPGTAEHHCGRAAHERQDPDAAEDQQHDSADTHAEAGHRDRWQRILLAGRHHEEDREPDRSSQAPQHPGRVQAGTAEQVQDQRQTQ